MRTRTGENASMLAETAVDFVRTCCKEAAAAARVSLAHLDFLIMEKCIMSCDETKQFDVIILGSGIGGSTLATILAKHQARVLMIDKGTHPRFAIGEAITSHTEILLSLLSHYYSVPELEYLSSFRGISENISASACGSKRSFGFLYHQEGKEQSPQERIQWGIGNSSHLFRQEIDHYLVKLAVKYGAKLLPETNIIDIDIDDKEVVIKTETGEHFNANYLVDASGYNSLIAKKLNLRENPPRFKSYSRSIFTHMVGVKPVDDCLQVNSDNIMPWHQGTAHHVFDGGWMWVIPFNNHEKSTNPICSIGLNLDSRRFPKTEVSPEQEFENFISRFPSIATQFETAKPVRNWISTGRLQYSSHSCIGKRFYLLPHASGFIDPIFSPGLIQTFTSIIPLAALILKAIASNDFSTKHFAPLERLQQDIFDYNDRITNCTYIAFTNFSLMNAWLRVWVFQHIIGGSYKLLFTELLGLLVEDYPEHIAKVEFKAKDLSQLTESCYLKTIDPRPQGWKKDFVEEAIAEVEKVEKGLLSPEEAALNIVSILNSTSWLFKLCGLGEPSKCFMDIPKSKRFNISLLTYAFWLKFFVKKETKPFELNLKDYINGVRLGII